MKKQEQVFNIFHPMEVKEKMRTDKSVCSVTTDKDNIYLQIDKPPFELASNEILEEKHNFCWPSNGANDYYFAGSFIW